MANRDTTSTPYKTSIDGVCYFAYPDGDAPVVTVANYTELRTKASADAGFGGSIAVSDPYQAGAFKYSATNPRPARGDDGGLVIAASGGGWWVRQFSYARSKPIELNWFESVVDNFDITTLFKRIATDFTPNFYVRVPDRAMKLVWNDTTTVNWSSAPYNILEFRLYESSVPVEIYIASPDVPTPMPVPRGGISAWAMTVTDFLLGSPVKKASYLDYLLTFSGTWTWDNRKLHDDMNAVDPEPKYVNSFYTISVTMQAGYPVQGAVRCNAGKLQSQFFYIAGNQNLTFSIAGRYRYATGVHVTGPGHFIFESPYTSDECARKPGWTGTTAGVLDTSYGLARTGSIGGVVAGSASSTTKVSGEIICQYGGATGYFFWDIVGNSIDDPLVLRFKDYGVTGPNEFGKPAGVHIQQNPSYLNHSAKSDGFGKLSANLENQRFFKLDVSYDAYGEFSGAWSWLSVFFIENNAVDDLEGADRTFTKHVTFIVVNARGRLWSENGPPVSGVEQELDHIHFMGDGVNPAWLPNANAILQMGLYFTLKYCKFHHVEMYYIGPELNTVNSTGKVTVHIGCSGTAANLTFSGAARNIIHFSHAYGVGTSSLAVTNLHAPVGSTITRDANNTATFTLNGVVKTLPYTVQVGDLGTAVPDIPPNPLLGAA